MNNQRLNYFYGKEKLTRGRQPDLRENTRVLFCVCVLKAPGGQITQWTLLKQLW